MGVIVTVVFGLAEMTRILLEVVIDEVLSYSENLKHPILDQLKTIDKPKEP